VVKIKALLPSLKENKRYILYEVESESKLAMTKNFIEERLREFLGDLGLAKAGLRTVKTKANKGIIQVNNNSLHEIKTGLALIKEINKSKVRIQTRKVSGVLNKIKNMV